MWRTVWRIVWRDPASGNIVFTGLTDYATWELANDALTTCWHWARLYTPTIESVNQ